MFNLFVVNTVTQDIFCCTHNIYSALEFFHHSDLSKNISKRLFEGTLLLEVVYLFRISLDRTSWRRVGQDCSKDRKLVSNFYFLCC